MTDILLNQQYSNLSFLLIKLILAEEDELVNQLLYIKNSKKNLNRFKLIKSLRKIKFNLDNYIELNYDEKKYNLIEICNQIKNISKKIGKIN